MKGQTMEKIDDGGPAFPFPGEPEHVNCPVCDSTIGSRWTGQSLRDYFAGQALAGQLSDPDNGGSPEDVARWSYKFADAMIEARKGKQ